MFVNGALRTLYHEVLVESLKVRVVDSGGDFVELETYIDRGVWIFKVKRPRHRYYLYPGNLESFMLRVFLQ